MGFLRRLRGGRRVPEWASFFNQAEYVAFVRTVEADLRRRGLAFQHRNGLIEIQRAGAEPDQLGVLNIAQKCRMADRADWPVVVAEHFSAVLSGQARNLDAIAADYDQAREILRLRLYADESMGGLTASKDGPVLRPL